ncbi:odorant receptor 82a-like [Vespula pensylvanica]|uniref:odorant receptor 82a-like n=1 Tax=Vespula pensylvanica TaxID=30213 RepID=UPI001CB9FBA5|nr:odorant receptor 82a-like [Vespula pensylvanica]XP_050868583.1 odorant receptor 82a-like [Vespula vulgaris]
METKMEARDITEAMKSLVWNKYLLKYIGLWPLEISYAHFLFYFSYLFLHNAMTISELRNSKHDFEANMQFFTENVLHLMVLTKVAVCWVNRHTLGRLLAEVENNFVVDTYNTFEKKFIFMKYSRLAKYYLIAAVTTMICTTVCYYIHALLPNVEMAILNSSLGYKPPYKTDTFVDIHDIRIYICLCIYQVFLVPTIILGYVGFDCLFANLAFHITAQFGVLSCMLREILDDSNGFRCNIKELVLRHYKLIRQAKILEDKYNVIIFQQLMGSTFQLCASGYNTLVGSVNSQTLTVMVFNFYASNTLCTLFTYCYIGECLIQESLSLNTAIYRYEWYNVSPINLKMVNICMLRMKKPEQLTSGKFFVLSLASFTDIIKTTMGYLSLVRTFM